MSRSIDNISSNSLKRTFQQQQQSSSYESDDLLKLLKHEGSQAHINDWVDYWYYIIGVNVIPADTKNKMTHVKWSEWQDKPIPEELHSQWKASNRYSDGIALIPGKVWRGPNYGKFLVFIDLDNQKAIEEVCNSFNCSNLENLADHVIVEQHKDNKNKAHLYFYSDHVFTKKSSDAVKMREGILNNSVPAIEVKGLGENGIAYCSPSLHKDGQKYEIIGTMGPKICGKEVEDRLFQIYKKYDLGIGNEGKVPVERLFDKDYTISEGHNRHEALLRIMESLIQRNKSILPPEQIKNIAKEWNNYHCIPPLDDKEIEKQWNDALNFINKADSNHPPVTHASKINRYMTKKIRDSPEVFYYADLIEKKIGKYHIEIREKNGELISKRIDEDIIIEAIPKKIFVHENNPLQKSPDRIKIIFGSSIYKDFEVGPYDNNQLIIKELENKHLVVHKKSADEALSGIIYAFKENKMVETREGLTTEGYYLLNGNLKIVGSLQNIPSELNNREQVKICVKFLNYLAIHGWKNKNIFPTVLKWCLVAPFSFSIKYNTTDNWLPWLYLYGCGQTGKTTLGNIVLFIWNLDPREKSVGFTNIDTVPKLGKAVSKDTYPILINEVGALSTINYKYAPILEAIKHSVESINCRGKFVDYNLYQDILALSPLLMTSDYSPPNDGSYNRRFISIHFSEEEKKEEKEQGEFKKLLKENKKTLSILGDFAASHIRDNPSVLIEKDWKSIAKEMLVKFYEQAEEPLPEWIDNFEEPRDAIEESSDNALSDLRAFIINKINDTYSKHKRYDLAGERDIYSKLCYCIENSLIPFILEKDEGILMITKNILKEIRLNGGIENITTLIDIGLLIGFESQNRYVNNKRTRVIEGTRKDMESFLKAEIK